MTQPFCQRPFRKKQQAFQRKQTEIVVLVTDVELMGFDSDLSSLRCPWHTSEAKRGRTVPSSSSPPRPGEAVKLLAEVMQTGDGSS